MKAKDDVTYEDMLERYAVVTCDNCDGETFATALDDDGMPAKLPLGPEWREKTMPHGRYISVDNGFCLDLTGHYGGFTDDMHGDQYRVVLCHDCALAVARALPGIFQRFRGHHSMTAYDSQQRGEKSCCEFSWKINPQTKEVLIGDGNGGWIADPHPPEHTGMGI